MGQVVWVDSKFLRLRLNAIKKPCTRFFDSIQPDTLVGSNAKPRKRESMSVHFFQDGTPQTVPCYRGLNILGHAQLEEIDLGSRCGGHGICGGDRVQVLPGSDPLSKPNETERQHLSPSEIADGWRLACQIWPEKDGDEIRIRTASEHRASSK